MTECRVLSPAPMVILPPGRGCRFKDQRRVLQKERGHLARQSRRRVNAGGLEVRAPTLNSTAYLSGRNSVHRPLHDLVQDLQMGLKGWVYKAWFRVQRPLQTQHRCELPGKYMSIEMLIEEWTEKVQDPSFCVVADWKEKKKKKVAGYFPVYTPLEVIHAAGMLPVGIMGAGNKLEIAHADARFGSFICSIAKSTMELGMRKNLAPFDIIFFQSICDTARNLAFLFKRNFEPELCVDYIHFPQNMESEAAIDFLISEFQRIIRLL